MISKDTYLNRKVYIKPEVTRVALDTSLVLMQVSNPGMMHTMPMAGGDGSKDFDTPFSSPFGDKPFS
jgi:hypothetical protein